jgi:putative flippase GtrA
METLTSPLYYLKEIFTTKPNLNVKIQFIRSIINGLISAVGDISILIVLTEFCGINYLISAAFGFIVGTTINYFISIAWVFIKGKFSNPTTEYFLFFTFSAIGLLINQAVMFIGVSILLFHYLLIKFFALSIVFIYNFLTKKYIVFSK